MSAPRIVLEAERIGVTLTGRPRYRWFCILPNGARAVLCVDDHIGTADDLVRNATSAIAAYEATESLDAPTVKLLREGPYR